MRILLLNLPWHENGRFGVRAGSRWPFTSKPDGDYIKYIPFPFFLAYAAAVLKKEHKEARLIDAIAEGLGEREFINKIVSYNSGLVVAEISTPSFKNDLRILNNIHRSLPGCQIAICGPHATVFPEEILTEYDFINYIFIGEYEYTLWDLTNHLEKNLSLNSVSGLAYREGVQVKVNNRRPAISNLNDLPWPERESLPIYKYNDGFCNLPKPNVQMLTSRGCTFHCIFCLWPQTIYRERKYRKRDPQDVVNEIEYLIDRFNFKAVYFDDDVFNIDRSHVLNICKGIKTRKIKIPWAAMARADLMDEELLKYLSGAGICAIKYGIESANPDILNFCKKKMDLSKVYKVIKITKRLGIKVHLTFCLGLPGETKRTVQETARFIQDVQPDSLQFSFATPFPGTEYFKYVKDRGWPLSGDWSDYDGDHKCIVKTQELANGELEEIKIALSNNFNLQ